MEFRETRGSKKRIEENKMERRSNRKGYKL